MVYFKALSRNFIGGAEENKGKLRICNTGHPCNPKSMLKGLLIVLLLYFCNCSNYYLADTMANLK
jgi:hypothetical protein